MGAGQIAGEHPCRQPVFGVIGAGQNLSLVLEIQHTHDRAENFLAGDDHLIGDIRENGGFDIIPLPLQPLTARDQPRTFFDALSDIAFHNAQLSFGHHRAKADLFIHRIADFRIGQPFRQPGQERLFDPLLHENPRAIAAHLPRGIEIPKDRAAHGVVQIRIIKDHQRGFAAQFHRDMFHASRSRRINLAPRRHRSGQRNLVHPCIRYQCAPHVARALNHVEQPGRQPRLVQDFSHFQRTKRCGFRWFEHHRIAASQRGCPLPAGDLRGIVPRPDANAHAQGLTHRISPVAAAQRDMFARQRRGQTTEIFQRVRPAGRIRHQRFLQGFPGVIGFQN